FYVIEPNKSVSINSIIESRDAIFDDNRFSSIPRSSQRSLINGTKDFGGSVVPEEVTEVKEAINDEMDFILGNNTWVLADLPLGCKPLGCKWIFKRKLKVDGTIEKFKARLAIQGFRQKSRIDYFNTYAPVARISTIRPLIAMASIHILIIYQMDVKTTFLNGELDEEVYMNQPQGFIMPGNENKVCKLIKSLYGLKQAPNKFEESGGPDKGILSSRFSMKDMGEANVILGIKIKHESNGIAISQSHYIEKGDWLPHVCHDLYKPDIAFVVGKLSRYTSNPVLEGYTDATRINNNKDNSSTRVFLLGGGEISWASKKHTCITSSIMKSEFVALVVASKEAKWLRNLILDIILWSKPIAPISIICDSAATLAKAYS
ncbi:zinc finger, CCHC-type containing protein, partial [Tanacetum coccineum]